MKVKENLQQLYKYPYYRCCTVLFFLVLLLNILVIQTADDFGYQINQGLFDIFHREYIQYMTWTGRTVAHIIARIFLALPKFIFNIMNSLCFVTLCVFIQKHSTNQKSVIGLLIIALLVFLIAPVFGQTVLWETGSCNYLWTTMIVLYALWIYRKQTLTSSIWYFLLGLLAGWSNENTGGAFILLLLFFLFTYYKQKCVTKKHLFELVGACIGYAFLMLAPGNRVRAADFVNTNGFAYTAIHDFLNFLDVLEQGQIVIWILFAILFCLCWLAGKKEAMRDAIYFAFANIAAVFAIVFSPVPVLYDRSMFGATIFGIISVMILLHALQDSKDLVKYTKVGLACCILFSCFHYLRALADLSYTWYQNRNRETYIQQQKAKGNLNPIVTQFNSEFFTKYNPLNGTSDISPYRLLWVNQYFAQSHGLESIQATTPDRFNKIYKDGNSELMNIIDFEEYLNKVLETENYCVLVNSTRLKLTDYESFLKPLASLGGTLPNQDTYVLGMIDQGKWLENPFYTEAQTKEGMLYNHYYYSSSFDDPMHADILIDQEEYTNDRPGITFVVYQKDLDRIVDVVTWTFDSDQGGTRYYLEN